MKVIKSDLADYGDRTIMTGEISLLQNFQCNATAPLPDTLYARYIPTIDRKTGLCTITVQNFLPAEMLKPPRPATHFKLVSIATEINFDDGTYTSDIWESACSSCTDAVVASVSLACRITPESRNPIFLLLGVQFFQRVNGVQYHVRDGSANPLSIVAVDMPL